MTAPLKDFLVELAIDTDKLAAFIDEPEEAMRRADLSEDDHAAVLSGDQTQIYAAIDPQVAEAAEARREAQEARGAQATPTYAFDPSQAQSPAPGGLHDERLIVIGTGIRTVGQMTMEAIGWMKKADKVLYIVGDPVAEALIHKLNPEGAESLRGYYQENKPRIETYNAMIETTLGYLREGLVVCLAAYGHPGVFAYPTHESLRRARAEGIKGLMLPAVSAEDCLFADLNFDPGMAGCQSYEATDFLINNRLFDPSSHVVLWQIGVLGDGTFKPGQYEIRGMDQLLQRLYYAYGPYHQVVLYEAPMLPGVEPTIRTIPLYMLPYAGATAMSTLYIPPGAAARTDHHLSHSLGLSQAS